jgi:hypothetical protein
MERVDMDKKQRHFVASYTSDGNCDTGEIHIAASSIAEAQDKFFAHLRSLPVYQHLWRLNVVFREVSESI